jgi:hypothetical protein
MHLRALRLQYFKQFDACRIGKMAEVQSPVNCPLSLTVFANDISASRSSDTSMRFVDGGIDPFTGQNVGPYFIATYPVTADEWVGFLIRFDWPPLKFW